MNKYKIIIHLHPSIVSDKHSLEGEVNQEILLEEALISILSNEKTVWDQIVLDEEIRPGYLLISNKTELRTTKQLKNKVASDMHIKIIPISHGG